MPRFTKHLWMIVLALTALVVLVAPHSQEAKQPWVVQIDEPFEIHGTQGENVYVEKAYVMRAPR